MNKPVVVFDFDKTLTEKDTVFGFYKFVSENSTKFKLKYPFFLVLAILSKLEILSNESLKKWGIRLFLKNIDQDTLAYLGKEYASNIKMNSIYECDFKHYPSENVIVMSASFEEYLNPLFPEYLVAGSKILCDKTGSVIGLERNLYGIKKLHWLQDRGIEKIDVLYTDSYSDRPLMNISECVYLIEGDEKSLLKGKDNEIYITGRQS